MSQVHLHLEQLLGHLQSLGEKRPAQLGCDVFLWSREPSLGEECALGGRTGGLPLTPAGSENSREGSSSRRGDKSIPPCIPVTCRCGLPINPTLWGEESSLAPKKIQMLDLKTLGQIVSQGHVMNFPPLEASWLSAANASSDTCLCQCRHFK